jgi:hypothetical protein
MNPSWHKCPKCGLDVVFDLEKKTAAHRDPECEWFASVVTTFGGSEGRVTVLDEAGRELSRGKA